MDPSGSLTSPRLPRLPAEILAYIIDLSASSEPAPSKHHLALALTSKAVHSFSERGRWRSIAIRTYSQLFFFSDYLGAQEEVLQQLCGEGRAGWKGSIGTRRWTPNPAKLAAYIVNFLIELDNPSFLQQTGSTTGEHALQELFIGILSRLTNGSPKLRVMSLSSIVLSGLYHIKQDPRRIARVRTSLSAPNEDACPLIGPFGPEELTLEWDGKEETLQAFLFSSCWCPPPEPLFGRMESHVNPPPVYIGLAARLRRLHLVGYDPQSPFDGFAIPIEILTNSVIAGSLKSTYHLVNVRQAAYKAWRKSLQRDGLTGKEDLVNSSFGSNTGPIPCVTHLRYDTVKFTLRPFEALAPRLLPFFEHLHVVGANYPSRSAATLTSRPNQKRTRHPFHEDNSYQISLNEIYSSQTDDRARLKETAEYHLRTALGAGAFARLHLAWDLPPLEQENEQLSSQIAAMSVSAAESGWPTERRDVWTNTSSAGSRIVNRSASGSGVRPKGPSTATSPFTMELAEAIEHRLQFPFTQQVFEARRNGTYPRKALVQNRSKEDLQALRRDPDLWPSDTERCADALARSLGEELVLRGYAPTRSAHRADVNEVLDLDSQVQLELIPISPYAPAPDGPAQVGPDLPRGSRGVYGAAASRPRPRPEPILKLGGSYAAVTPNERIRLFLDRIQGKSGSW